MDILRKIPLGVYIVLITATIAFAAAGQGVSTWVRLTTIATGDLFPITDISDLTVSDDGSHRAITWGNLMAAPGAIGGTTPAAGTFTTVTASERLAVTQGEDPDYVDLREGTDYGGTYTHRLSGADYSADYTSPLPGYQIGWLASDQVDSGGDLADESVDKAHLAIDAKFYSIVIASLGDATTPSVLTIDESTNTCISNYQSSGADHVFTLPSPHVNGNVIFQIGAQYQVDIEPSSGQILYLNGTALAADEHIVNDSDTLLTKITGYCLNIEGTLRWIFYSSDSEWEEATP